MNPLKYKTVSSLQKTTSPPPSLPPPHTHSGIKSGRNCGRLGYRDNGDSGQ